MKKREPKFKSVSVESKESARLLAGKKKEFRYNLFEAKQDDCVELAMIS